MMIYQAKLLGLNNLIEEEVALEVNGKKIVGFANICPYKLVVGSIYQIEIHLTFLDEQEFLELKEEKYGLKKLNGGYGYMLYGKVEHNYINIGNDIKIEDDFFEEYSYLNGKNIQLKVDRISVEFK